MADRDSHQILRRAVRHWRLGSLWPYACLALAVSAVEALGTWPDWTAPASAAAITLALLLDGNWRLSRTRICRRLDGRFAEVQDSSQLLNRAAETLAPLTQLQRRRTTIALQQLLAGGALKSFRPHWHRSLVVSTTGACLGLFIYAALDALPQHRATNEEASTQTGVTSASIKITEALSEIQPPAYTGLPATTQALQVEAPEQSRITWRITLNTPVDALTMLAAREAFAFRAAGELPSRQWQLTRTLAQTDFYQLSLRSSGEEKLLPEIHNIAIEADQLPEFSFELPRDTVTEINGDDRNSPLLQVDVQVADDFQVVQTDLLITLASGNGENVRFRNERIKLEPQSTSRDNNINSVNKKNYRFRLPLHRYQMKPGDELYWFLQARDNREPKANLHKSQHFILRWPQEEIFGLSDAEGMAIKVMPEYFRSQRQLIIDTEALLTERDQLSEAEFRKRSQSLAYEQKLLRMRYGRFLGEEDSELEHGDEDHGDGEHGEHGDNHDSVHSGATQQFGDDEGIIAAAGHSHDSSEHATLFDPQTKELLRSALNAMWSSWRELSVIEPRASLPHQHTALRFIKEVQQASRIYLQRVGFEAPALDEGRRLSGERDGIKPPRINAARGEGDREQLLQLLQRVNRGDVLDDDTAAAVLSLEPLHGQPQLRMELSKNLRLYRQQADCTECRQELSSLLYRLLPTPQAQPSLPRERTAAGDFRHWLREQSGERE